MEEIDPNIENAYTLPAAYYTNASYYSKIMKNIFTNSWHLVCDTEDIKVPGQIIPVQLLEGSVEEPVLVTRDYNDQVRCISNICTHRGALVAENPSIARSLRCPYHHRNCIYTTKYPSLSL